jgi:predicted P-loop ATPase
MNEETMTVEEVKALLETTRKGFPSNSIDNCLTVFRSDPMLKGAIKRNCLTGRTDIVKELGWSRESATLTDTDMKYLLLHFEKNYGLTSEKKIMSAMSIIANENRYHPIRDYLNRLKWDGVERIRFALHRYLGADTSDFTYECLKLFMLGAIKRVFYPGSKFEMMLCLVGGQGAGKSTFFRFLAVNDEWFSDDLKKLDDENVYRKLEGHWIIEMSEMIATANARSIEEIKSFISRQKETYKVPYETYPADRPRQCVFGGTTNKQDFLPKDRTGNRRFLPVRVHAEEAEAHLLDDEESSRAYIDQMWAEAMEIFRSGKYSLKLPKKIADHLKEYQLDFMQEDTQAGQIYAWLDDFSGDKVCSKMIYREALGNGFKEPADWETRAICEIMNTGIDNGDLVGWKKFTSPTKIGEYGKQKGWERVPVNGNQDVNRVENRQMEFVELSDDDDLPF